MITVLLLLVSFAVILLGAKLFTNAVEWTGLRLGLGEAAVGSLLAAIGTALPETMIAVVALIAATEESKDVAIGAIIGAPFMLATIAMVVVGVSAIAFSDRRLQGDRLVVNREVALRDLSFFAVAFSTALLAALVHVRVLQIALAVVLISAYPVYFKRTLGTQGELSDGIESLTFARAKQEPRLGLILLQLVFSLALVVGAAQLFVEELIEIAELLGAPPLVLSLVLAPLATELPEKANSVIWVRDGKDTLALGNISGAMVFQSTLPISLGLLFTSWDLNGTAELSIALGVVGGIVAALYVRLRGAIEKSAIAAAALLYAVFLAYVFIFA